MILDLRTLYIVFVTITVSLCILMLFIWRTNRTYPGFGLWTLANVSAAAGFVFLVLYGSVSEFATVIIANTLTFGSTLLCFLGNRRFLDFSRAWLFSIATLALNSALMIYFEYFDNQPGYRIISLSLLLVIVSGRSAYDFRRAWLKEGNASYAFVSVVYLTFSIAMFARAASTYWLAGGGRNWIQPLSFLVFIIFAIAWTFIYMILNNEKLQQELKTTRAEFEKLATTDFLTGINNNRRFFEIGEIEIQRARRFRHALTVIMFDIDYFKKINDTYGHAAGDAVLIAIVDICKFNLRELDTLGRLGGEEFGILLPHTDIDVAKMVAGRLRRAFDETRIALPSDNIKITASFGVTELSETDKTLKDLLDRADSALYEAKQSGRNQVKASVSSERIISETLPKISSAQIM